MVKILSTICFFQYEMLELYIRRAAMGKKSYTEAKLKYLLEGAFQYLYECFGVDLKINNNIDPNSKGSDVRLIANMISKARHHTTENPLVYNLMMGPIIRVDGRLFSSRFTKPTTYSSILTATRHSTPIPFKDETLQLYFTSNFKYANIFQVDDNNEKELTCLLCQKEIKPDTTVDAHFDDECFAFKPPYVQF